MEFDDLKVHQATSTDALTPRSGGLADASLVSSELRVDNTLRTMRGGDVVVEGFSDDYYTVEVDVKNHAFAFVWVRRVDANNGYQVRLKGLTSVAVWRYVNGELTTLGTISLSPAPNPRQADSCLMEHRRCRHLGHRAASRRGSKHGLP